ncbi:MAG TPA: hypothetical protein VFZ65_13405 [Planctomycetota bacterium]|nr:hypothetical protein [Planctomycetota bacterium]
MNRLLTTLSAAALFATGVTAQCLNVASPGTLIGIGDDTYFTTHYALGFAFPVAGSVNGTYTHFRVSCNGWLVLTDGVTTPAAGAPASYGSVASVLGAAGGAPRILPFARDLNLTAANSAGLYYDNTSNPGVSCRISWVNAVDYSNLGPAKSFQVELFNTGEIKMTYSSPCNVIGASSAYVAVSNGNGVVDPGQADLSAAPASAVGAIYQVFPTGSFDLGGSSIVATPSGSGYSVATTCQFLAASHNNYGSGCYNISDSFYQTFADSSLASPALSGNAMMLVPTGAGYTGYWLAGAAAGRYVAPNPLSPTYTVLGTGDDGQVTYTPAVGFPSPYGPVTDLRVHGNAIIAFGSGTIDTPGTNNYVPAAAGFLNSTRGGVYAWHDYNVAEGGTISGDVVGSVTYVTYENVESYSTPTVVNPSTLQFQFDQVTGVITVVWVSVDGDPTSTFGSGHLVGFTPAGASVDNGSIDLATALPVTVAGNVAAISTSASPAPVSTAGSGTLVTYTIDNIPEAVPTSGVYFGVTIVSLTPDLAGLDLGFLGMPQCSLYVGALDLTLSFVGGTPSQTTMLQIPAGVAYGTQIYATSAALIAPGTLPNGQNAFGAVTSNGVRSFISSF